MHKKAAAAITTQGQSASHFAATASCVFQNYLFLFSHFWLATPQLVLQADWQEVWHSPQPPFLALSHRLRVAMVLILFMIRISYSFLPAPEAPEYWLSQQQSV
jgi:hypothetical protein